MRTLALLATLAATLIAADAARAATVMHDAQGNVVLDAAPGETNTVFVQPGANGTVILNDATAPLQAWDDGCTQIGDRMVECTAGAYVSLFLDDGNDRSTVDLFYTGGVFAYGEAGDDQLVGGPVVNGLDGGPGNDKLTGGEGHDSIHGGDGNDELSGLGGADELYGEGGDDLLSGDSHKAPAADVVDGGPGIDRIEQDWNDLTDALVNLTLAGGADDGRPGEGDDIRNVEKLISFHAGTFAGTAGAERIEIVQSSQPSSLSGGAGDDFLKASDGADNLDGGPGADTIDGGFNNDTIVGGPGPDTIHGDHPTGECGIYWCKLPAGNDTIDARDGEVDNITCGFGTDTVRADPIDIVASDCENVTGASTGGGGGSGGASGGGGHAAPRLGLKVARATRSTLRLRLQAPSAGRVRVTATVKGRRVARATRSVKAGRSTLTLRFAKRPPRRAQLKVAARFTARDGATASKTTSARVR
jgi:Ca2+-binding RTX toxin-like protein